MSAAARALAVLTPRIGHTLGVSDWTLVDQPMIDAFAEVSGDHQWIHVDPARAARTAYGGTIAHGFLTLSLASRFAHQVIAPPDGMTMSVNYGLDRIRFLAPVRSGSRLRGHFVLQDAVRRDATSVQRQLGLTIEIENHDTPALAAVWLGLWIFPD